MKLEDKLQQLREFYKTETDFRRKDTIVEIARLYKKAGENPQSNNIDYRRAKLLEQGFMFGGVAKDVEDIFFTKQLSLETKWEYLKYLKPKKK